MGRQKDDIILEAFITETSQLVEQLEGIILECEDLNEYSEIMINEIFRIMHTIKGSSSMMHFDNIAALAHGLEDLFSLIREHKLQLTDWSPLSDVMLDAVDFTKVELATIINGEPAGNEASDILRSVSQLLTSFEQQRTTSGVVEVPEPNSTAAPLNHFKAVVHFTEDCDMQNIRSFQIVHIMKGILKEYSHIPGDLDHDKTAIEVIRNHGFQLFMKTDKSYEEIQTILSRTVYLKNLELESLQDIELQATTQIPSEPSINPQNTDRPVHKDQKQSAGHYQSNSIKVNVGKLDELLDLVGELVIAEVMVTQNPDVVGLNLEQFQKASRHLQKITREIQDKVMEIRMVPLATTFQKMSRVVRDMSKKLSKNVQLKLVGEDTEVDKNVIEHISDPIMHLVRNAIDHGLETAEDRLKTGKSETGTVTLEAQNAGSEVVIIVKEDGRGLNRMKILEKAKKNQILFKSETEMTDKEVYNLIFLPGFSTKVNITEFSGRGVGMDVVMQNIAAVGGTVSIDSVPGNGTSVLIRIPLTLSIIDGMNVRVGNATYTLPTTAIKQTLKPKLQDIITDPDGNEMVMIRGSCYPILRLHERYRIPTKNTRISDGILVMVEQDETRICIFADELLGQHQVVIKALPPYIRSLNKIEGISGCTLLGDGDISLILDVQGLLKMK